MSISKILVGVMPAACAGIMIVAPNSWWEIQSPWAARLETPYLHSGQHSVTKPNTMVHTTQDSIANILISGRQFKGIQALRSGNARKEFP